MFVYSRMFKLWVVIALWLTVPAFSQQQPQQQERGVGVEMHTNDGVNGSRSKKQLYDNSYALIVVMNKYQNTKPWPELPGTVEDEKAVREVLTEQGFKVETAIDLTGDELKARLEKFMADYGSIKDARLIVYFAAHGVTLPYENKEVGYVVPIDAPRKEEPEFFNNALSMERIIFISKEIKVKHALFVFDGCYSGSLIQSKEGLAPKVLGEYLRKPARQFLTSGTSREVVPDASFFRKEFVRGLRGAAEYVHDGYITASELAYFLQREVNQANRRQTPQFGVSEDPGFQGDMVFVPKELPYDEQLEKEKKDWEGRKKSGEQHLLVEWLEGFVKRFPLGKYTADAEWELKKLDLESKESGMRGDVPVTPVMGVFKFTTLKAYGEGIEEKNVPAFDEELAPGVRLRMISVPSGEFDMGDGSIQLKNHEAKPLHKVSIPRFYLSAYEITRGQWRAVAKMKHCKGRLKEPEGQSGADDLPIVNITWEQAQEFCKCLSELTKSTRTYRLPSESEWEYAARSGTKTLFAFGNQLKAEWVNYDAGTKSNSSQEGLSQKKPVAVGSLNYANPFGLYDMHGNVAEWCEDNWNANYDGAPKDGTAWFNLKEPRRRVVRGGAYDSLAIYVQSNSRRWAEQGERSVKIGFRVALGNP